MNPEKKPESAPRPPAAPGARKAWTPRSPVEVMLEQIAKQEKKVAELEKELEHEKATVTKLLQAKKVLESI